MKKLIAVVIALSVFAHAGAIRSSYKYGVKPGARVAKYSAKKSAHGVKKAAHLSAKAIY